MKNVDNINNHFLIICCLLLGYCKSNNSRVNEIHTEKYDFNKEIFNNIDTACKFLKQVKHLELGFIKGGFPLRLLDFENLESLVILYSELDSIPNEINKLIKLKKIHINYSRLKFIPFEIGDLKEIEDLAFMYNFLTDIPQEICKLSKLKKINLTGNQIDTLDTCICNLKSLKLLALSYFPEDKHIDSITYNKLKYCLPKTGIALRPIE